MKTGNLCPGARARVLGTALDHHLNGGKNQDLQLHKSLTSLLKILNSTESTSLFQNEFILMIILIKGALTKPFRDKVRLPKNFQESHLF